MPQIVIVVGSDDYITVTTYNEYDGLILLLLHIIHYKAYRYYRFPHGSPTYKYNFLSQGDIFVLTHCYICTFASILLRITLEGILKISEKKITNLCEIFSINITTIVQLD